LTDVSYRLINFKVFNKYFQQRNSAKNVFLILDDILASTGTPPSLLSPKSFWSIYRRLKNVDIKLI